MELHAALSAALKARSVPVTHECGDEPIFFWDHLEDWIKDPEAAGIVKMVRVDDGLEAFWNSTIALTHTRLSPSLCG